MAEAMIDALIGIGIGIVIAFAVFALFYPYYSIVKIHKSIDRLTDEVVKWRKEKDDD